MNYRNLLLLLIFCLPFEALGQLKSNFSKNDVLKDLEYLHSSLIDAHYNVYAYTSEQQFDSVYQAEKAMITKDSISLLETTNAFQRLASVINNAHTLVAFPVQPYYQYGESGGTLFPLELAFEDGKALIRKNWSGSDEIKLGSEVLSINDQPTEEILQKIYPQISAERLYFKNALIEGLAFPRYYWQVLGRVDKFEVEIRSGETITKYDIKAVSLIDDFEMKRYDVLNAYMNLKFLGKSAYLNPGNLSGDEPKFRRFIDSCFVEIKAHKSKNLIIDLRNNQGGDDAFSDYIVSYFANKPFRWNSDFTLKTGKFLKEHTRANRDTTTTYNQNILRHKDGEVYSYEFEPYQPQHKKKRFKGKIYVLVNRHSYSQSAVMAAQIQDYSWGTIVGEETADSPTLYASMYEYTLPQTGIIVKVAKGYMIRVNGSTKEEGVVPDIFIRDHLLDEEDEILDGLLKKLGEN